MHRMTGPLRVRLALWWLVLALVLAPTLGRMHQVVHAPALGGAVAHTHAAAEPAGDAVDAPHALFSGHAGSDCQLLDQQLLGGAPLTLALALPPALPDAAPVAQASLPAGARWLSPFQARGPPALA